ncbi:MAG: hypothetical protein ACREML_14600, partial [Vulcanimicrobiaceae bacterium]
MSSIASLNEETSFIPKRRQVRDANKTPVNRVAVAGGDAGCLLGGGDFSQSGLAGATGISALAAMKLNDMIRGPPLSEQLH